MAVVLPLVWFDNGWTDEQYINIIIWEEKMFVQFMSESNIRETEFYDDLSNIILIFKRCISLAESVTAMVQKGQEYSSNILKMKQVLEELDPLKQKYSKISYADRIEHITFHRFSSRLLEIISNCNNKYHRYPNSHPYPVFFSCLKQLESIIRLNQEQRNLFKLIKISQMSFVKFCMNCKALDSTKAQQSQRKCQETYKEMKQKIIQQRTKYEMASNKKLDKREQIEKYEQDSDDSDFKSDQEGNFNNTQGKKFINLNKIPKQLSILQNRFKCFKGLDIDFANFKSTYYIAKNNKEQFYRQYLNRNTVNRRIITCYYDDFYLFQKKKSQKEGRRDKFKKYFIPNKGNYDRTQLNLNMDGSSEQIRRIGNNKIILANHKLDNTISQGLQQSESLQDFSNKSLEFDCSKKQLKMKNVQITLWKKNKPQTRTKINTNFGVCKNTSKLQPMCINQSYYNDLELQTKNSLQFIHSKLKPASQIKQSHKTELSVNKSLQKQKIQLISLCEINQVESYKSDKFNFALKSRSTFKGKYLEINCTGQKQDERRVITKQGGTITRINLKNVRSQCNRKLIIKLDQQ